MLGVLRARAPKAVRAVLAKTPGPGSPSKRHAGQSNRFHRSRRVNKLGHADFSPAAKMMPVYAGTRLKDHMAQVYTDDVEKSAKALKGVTMQMLMRARSTSAP